jgi:integrase/recombinase XerD
VLSYTAVRADAVAKLKVGDLTQDGSQFLLRFLEKGGKSREIPLRHDVQAWVLEYLAAAGIDRERDKELPLFRSRIGKANKLSGHGVTRKTIWGLVKRHCTKRGAGPRYRLWWFWSLFGRVS